LLSAVTPPFFSASSFAVQLEKNGFFPMIDAERFASLHVPDDLSVRKDHPFL